MKSELTKAHNYSLLEGSIWIPLRVFFLIFFSSLVQVTCQSTAILQLPRIHRQSAASLIFVRLNSRNGNMVVFKNKYSWVMLIGNNVADLITVKWVQMFDKPETTEYFGRIFSFFLLFIVIFMADFCQWDLCCRRLENSWSVTRGNMSVRFDN